MKPYCIFLRGIMEVFTDKPPFVSVGQAIEAGQTVAVIEAMKMFHPVKAKVAGKLVEILAQAGVEVEAGQALFRLG